MLKKDVFFVKTRRNLVKQFQKLIFTFSEHRSYKTLFNYFVFISFQKLVFQNESEFFGGDSNICRSSHLGKICFFHSTILLSGKM